MGWPPPLPPFEQCSKKLHFSHRGASLITLPEVMTLVLKRMDGGPMNNLYRSLTGKGRRRISKPDLVYWSSFFVFSPTTSMPFPTKAAYSFPCLCWRFWCSALQYWEPAQNTRYVRSHEEFLLDRIIDTQLIFEGRYNKNETHYKTMVDLRIVAYFLPSPFQ